MAYVTPMENLRVISFHVTQTHFVVFLQILIGMHVNIDVYVYMTATVCMWVGIYLSVNFYGSGTPWFWGHN